MISFLSYQLLRDYILETFSLFFCYFRWLYIIGWRCFSAGMPQLHVLTDCY